MESPIAGRDLARPRFISVRPTIFQEDPWALCMFDVSFSRVVWPRYTGIYRGAPLST